VKKKRKIFTGYQALAFCALFLLVSLSLNLFGRLPYVFTAISFMIILYGAVIFGYFKQTRNEKITTLFLFVIVLLVLGQFVRDGPTSANDRSRLGTMHGLVHDNTFELGAVSTHDKVYINEKFYSSKPPVLSFLGAGVYAVAREVANWQGKDVEHPNKVYFWITLFLITIPSALAVVLFYKLLAFTKIEEYYRILLSLAFIFGTLMFSYSGVINNHTAAAVSLLAGFYFLCYSRFNKSVKAVIASGFFFALAGTFDLPSFVFMALFAVLLLVRKQYRFCLWYITGALLPLIFHFSFQYQITGDFLPQYMHKGVYNWPGSPHGKGGHRPLWSVYLWRMTLGNRGLLMYTPLLLFSMLGLGLQLRKFKQKFWLEAAFTLTGILVILALYAIRGPRDFGGQAYGFRWLIIIIPLLFFFTAFIFENRHRSTWFRSVLLIVFLIVLVYSVYVAFLGTGQLDRTPWRTYAPPFYFKFPF